MPKYAVVVVTVLYGLIVGLAVLLLVAVQLRTPGGTAEYDKWQAQYDAFTRQLNAKRAELSAAKDAQSLNQQDLAFTIYCLDKFFPNGVYDETKVGPELSAQVNETREAIQRATREARVKGTESWAAMNKIVDDTSNDERCLVKGHTWLTWDKIIFTNKGVANTATVRELTASVEASGTRLEGLVKGREPFLVLYTMGEKWYQKPFFRSSYDLLVMLLILTMGALGGVVRLLRDYGTKNVENPAPQDYFLIPAIGIVAAIAGFVLAKTGLLVLSSADAQASLSPYMIGFLGLISGLLAKDVIGMVATKGEILLQASLRKAEAERAKSTPPQEQASHEPGQNGNAETAGNLDHLDSGFESKRDVTDHAAAA